MESQYERQLKRGVLQLLVLHRVCAGRTYGYELCSELDARSGGLFRLAEGTLYPILYRLEDEGLIQSCWSAPSRRGAAKKYYEATDAGRMRLAEMTAAWQRFDTCVNAILREETKADE